MNLSIITEQVGGLIGLEEEVLDTLKEYNKNKFYPVSIVSLVFNKDGSVTTNAKEYEQIIDNLVSIADDITENTLEADVIKEKRATYKIVSDALVGMRKQSTNPLKDITTTFTTPEKKIAPADNRMKAKFEQINEASYAISEDAIVTLIKEALDKDGLSESVKIEVFQDFIDKKRKTNIFTSKGSTTKAINDEVEKVVNLVIEPIKKAIDLAEKVALQTKQFESYLDNFETVGETQKLEANINGLIAMKSTITELYPNIVDRCNQSIDNKIARCESSIKTNAELDARLKEKEKLEAIEKAKAVIDVDKDVMDKFNFIKDKSIQNLEDAEETKKEVASLGTRATKEINKEAIRDYYRYITEIIKDLKNAEEPIQTEESTQPVEKDPNEILTIPFIVTAKRAVLKELQATLNELKEKGLSYE